MGKVLITDDVHPLMIEGLQLRGYETDFQPDISLEVVKHSIHHYEGLIINSKILVDKDLLDRATQLTFVARLGSGMEIVDKPYAAAKGVAVFSSPEGNCNAVAEHALGMLLAFANNLVRSDREVRNFDWQREKNRGFELRGRTIGVIGFGHTGSTFASKLIGLGMDILVYDKYKTNYTTAFPYVKEVRLEQLQAEADIISFHLPLTTEVIHFMNDDFLNKCKSDLVVINTSRGKVIDTEVLLKGLKNKKISGACLDVFENEKVGTFSEIERSLYTELYGFDQVILSPHIAGWTQESKQQLSQILLEKIDLWKNGTFGN
jgi:D-3-phosphoglycerate dehydrogenase